jgi:hypothetical protein
MRRWMGVVMLGGHLSCASVPKPGTIHPRVGTEQPRLYQIPSTFRDSDLICEDPNQPGTCATVADVRQFLHSRKTNAP